MSELEEAQRQFSEAEGLARLRDSRKAEELYSEIIDRAAEMVHKRAGSDVRVW